MSDFINLLTYYAAGRRPSNERTRLRENNKSRKHAFALLRSKSSKARSRNRRRNAGERMPKKLPKKKKPDSLASVRSWKLPRSGSDSFSVNLRDLMKVLQMKKAQLMSRLLKTARQLKVRSRRRRPLQPLRPLQFLQLLQLLQRLLRLPPRLLNRLRPLSLKQPLRPVLRKAVEQHPLVSVRRLSPRIHISRIFLSLQITLPLLQRRLFLRHLLPSPRLSPPIHSIVLLSSSKSP